MSGSSKAGPRRASPGPSTPSTRPGCALRPVTGLRRGGAPAHRVDRPAVRQPGPARQGRAGPGSRPRGPEAIARDPQPCHRRPGADRPPRAPAARLRRLSSASTSMPPWSGTRSSSTPATVVVHRLDDDRELVRLPGPEQRDFWYATSWLQPGRRAAGGRLRLAGGGGILSRSGTWDAGSCSAACRAREA